MSIPISVPLQSLSAVKSMSICGDSVTLTQKLSHLSITPSGSIRFKSMPIQMGGGPRTYPGGVSKWQWKRMQAKKAKQLLKARLARERQIYEMRKRAELKAAVSELERPWEVVEKPPNLFSVSADEQLKVLADRFQKPGGLDLWSENDGPELFRPDNGLPSMRFFPKGVVHSAKPYGKIDTIDATPDAIEPSGLEEDSVIAGKMDLQRKRNRRNSRASHGSSSKGENVNGNNPECRNSLASVAKEKVRIKGGRRKYLGDLEGKNYEMKMDSQVFDMSLQNDGVYGFELDDLIE
ncbi:uncharacterized protein LOC127251140 [Andrographis paniculata]|uniref:uncharacterized protein LOC127251140 n=1 Tax=Andrographis paniculata TaxID=175694 RepID=UPI0021E8F70F|nr:uncharacterized protein LOC127251140 [Andrographis paniculata]